MLPQVLEPFQHPAPSRSIPAHLPENRTSNMKKNSSQNIDSKGQNLLDYSISDLIS
jgi:hypothetical protein